MLQSFICFFDKTSAMHADKGDAKGDTIKTEIMSNQQSAANLADGLHKPIAKNLENVKYTHLLKIVYGVQIFIFIVNMSGLFS